MMCVYQYVCARMFAYTCVHGSVNSYKNVYLLCVNGGACIFIIIHVNNI